ncbi:MAG: hypothetical protein AAGF94_20715 [Pseudomonadota bacterium]
MRAILRNPLTAFDGRAGKARSDELIRDAESRPWTRLEESDFAAARKVPSMLSDEELRFYFWIAQQLAATPGAIVDLGAFIGGSTAHLAAGSQAGGASDKLVFAFDHFAATEKVKQKQLYAKGIARFEGDDFLNLSKRLLTPWAPQIKFRPGRIEEQSWKDGPISLLVLDVSKTTAVTDYVAKTFFPSLIPYESVIVQQDELHWKEPWITAQMQRLANHFRAVCHIPGSAMVYLCTRRVGSLALRHARVARLTDDQLLADLNASAERLAPFGVNAQIDRQKEALRLNPGMRKAWRFKNRPPRHTPR